MPSQPSSLPPRPGGPCTVAARPHVGWSWPTAAASTARDRVGAAEDGDAGQKGGVEPGLCWLTSAPSPEIKRPGCWRRPTLVQTHPRGPSVVTRGNTRRCPRLCRASAPRRFSTCHSAAPGFSGLFFIRLRVFVQVTLSAEVATTTWAAGFGAT